MKTTKEGYLRRSEAAKYLGVSIRTIADWQSRRLIPFYKPGERTVLFKVADLDTALERYKVCSVC